MQNTACMLVVKKTPPQQCAYSYGTHPPPRLHVRKAECILQFLYYPLLVSAANKTILKKLCLPISAQGILK